MKNYTDLDQSKKLAKFLSIESADMFYTLIDKGLYLEVKQGIEPSKDDIPCWSLATLMNVLDRGALFKTPQGWACQAYIDFKAITSDHYNNPIDACVNMIIKLHELNLL